jgi:hypothetical protein
MNNLFSWKRFAKLFKKHTADHYKSYLISVVVAASIIFLLLTYIQFHNEEPINPAEQVAFFIAFFLILGTIFTSAVFTELSIDKKAISALTLPVSHLEKFLVTWIYSFILFQVVYVLGFYMIIYLVSKTGNFSNDVKLFDLFNQKNKPYQVFLMYSILHACMFLGAIAFKKWHFFKTTVVILSFGILLIVANSQLLKISIGEIDTRPFMGLSYVENGKNYYMDVENSNVQILYFLLPLLLWTSAYFRLKEKQV